MLSITSKEDFDNLLNNNSKVVVDFWAEWCGPCRTFSPMFESVGSSTEGIAFVKVNIDSANQLMSDYNVQSIPTIIYIKDGKEVRREIGCPSSESVFRKTISEILE